MESQWWVLKQPRLWQKREAPGDQIIQNYLNKTVEKFRKYTIFQEKTTQT